MVRSGRNERWPRSKGEIMKIDSLLVLDAEKPIEVRLSGDNIVDGEENNPSSCAIALAAMKTTHILDARIDVSYAFLRLRREPNVWRRYALPASAADFVNAFDNNSKVKDPQIASLLARTICLKPVPESKRLGYRSGSSGTNVRRPKNQKVSKKPRSIRSQLLQKEKS